MASSAQTATLPESDMFQHNEAASTQPHVPSPIRFEDTHCQDGLYRHYSTPQLPEKYEPESYPFIFPSGHPAEAQFVSPNAHKIISHPPSSYLSPTCEDSYATCESPHQHPASIQDPRTCPENFHEYPPFRIAHDFPNHEHHPARPEYHPHSHSYPPPSHVLPLISHSPESYLSYHQDVSPTSDYYTSNIHPMPYGYYPARNCSFSDVQLAPMNESHHPLSVQTRGSDRPFKCDACPAGFNRNHDLKRHTRIHLAVKPFPCGWCEKSFSRKDALKRHLMVKNCAGTGKVSVDESIRRATEMRLSKNGGLTTPSFTVPFPAAHAPTMSQSSDSPSHSPINENEFVSSTPNHEDGRMRYEATREHLARYSLSDTSAKPLRDGSEEMNTHDRFTPYPRYHRSQPNILAYGQPSWAPSNIKPSTYQNPSESTAVLPSSKPSELSTTSSISNLLDGPDYGPDFRSTYSCDTQAVAHPIYSHPSPPDSYPQISSFPGEDYPRSTYHSTPRSSTSESMCSSSTMTTTHITPESESPAPISQVSSSLTPPMTPNGTAILCEVKPYIAPEMPVTEDVYSIDIKPERISRSPTPQDVPCISTLRYGPK